jgi:hypothetical protein
MKSKHLTLYLAACLLIGTAIGCALLPPEDGNPSTTQPSTQPVDQPASIDINSPAFDAAAALVPYGAIGLLILRLFFLERQKRDAKTRAKERTNPTVE